MTPLLHSFASEQRPIRVSSIPSMMRCSARSVILFANLSTDVSGEPAASGSAFHCLVEAWHNSNFNGAQARRVEESRRHEWPLAKASKVEDAFVGYSGDERNRIQLLASEIEVKFTIDPSPDDPTGDLIYLIGHLDQLRRDDRGQPVVWDMKLSKSGGADLINSYAYQLMLYAMGATKHLGREVRVGGIIRCSTYLTAAAKKVTEPEGVFFPLTLNDEVTEHMVKDVAATVAAIRRGQVASRPGDYCGYCPVGHISRCVPLIKGVCGK